MPHCVRKHPENVSDWKSRSITGDIQICTITRLNFENKTIQKAKMLKSWQMTAHHVRKLPQSVSKASVSTRNKTWGEMEALTGNCMFWLVGQGRNLGCCSKWRISTEWTIRVSKWESFQENPCWWNPLPISRENYRHFAITIETFRSEIISNSNSKWSSVRPW